MPRTARLDYPDILQHVMVRGVNRCDIFVDDSDRRKFLKRFSQLLVETQTDCFAWALMPNHVHLLLRPRRSRLAHLMRRLLTGYAIYFNRRHDRCGHLFQNRYKSVVCDENTYLHELVRYIHLNPLRANVVDDLKALDGYPWTGHGVLMGQGDLPGQNVDEVLALFASYRERGRRKYREFVADGCHNMEPREDLVGKQAPGGADEGARRDSRILGDEAFVEQMLGQQALDLRSKPSISIEDLVQRVCENFSVDPADIRRNTRAERIAKARSVICYLAVREAGYSGVEVGGYINLGRAGVSRAAFRGAEIVRAHNELLDLVDE